MKITHACGPSEKKRSPNCVFWFVSFYVPLGQTCKACKHQNKKGDFCSHDGQKPSEQQRF